MKIVATIAVVLGAAGAGVLIALIVNEVRALRARRRAAKRLVMDPIRRFRR